MADTTNEDLKNLILSLDKKFDARFVELDKKIDHLDKKMEVGFAQVDVKFADIRGELKEVHREISEVRTELKGEIQKVYVELKGEIKTVEAKLDGFDKRISYQEFISKGIVVTVFGGILVTIARFIFTLDTKKAIADIIHLFNLFRLS